MTSEDILVKLSDYMPDVVVNQIAELIKTKDEWINRLNGKDYTIKQKNDIITKLRGDIEELNKELKQMRDNIHMNNNTINSQTKLITDLQTTISEFHIEQKTQQSMQQIKKDFDQIYKDFRIIASKNGFHTSEILVYLVQNLIYKCWDWMNTHAKQDKITKDKLDVISEEINKEVANNLKHMYDIIYDVSRIVKNCCKSAWDIKNNSPPIDYITGINVEYSACEYQLDGSSIMVKNIIFPGLKSGNFVISKAVVRAIAENENRSLKL